MGPTRTNNLRHYPPPTAEPGHNMGRTQHRQVQASKRVPGSLNHSGPDKRVGAIRWSRSNVLFHLPGVRRTTLARPDREILGGESNIIQYEFRVMRGGRGPWIVDLYPRLAPGVLVDDLSDKFVRYALVISVIGNRRLDVYHSIRSYLRKVSSTLS